MATPTQSQPYGGNNQYPPATGAPVPSQSGYSSQATPLPATPGQYGAPHAGYSFDKFCVIHIATTCDEHGVYVTKDSAEVIEIGWVVVDARDPSLPEVCRIHLPM